MFWKKRQKIPLQDEPPVLPPLADDMSNLLPEIVAVVDEILDNAAVEEEKIERLEARGVRLLAPDAFQYGSHIYRSIGKAKWERIDAHNHHDRVMLPSGFQPQPYNPLAKESVHPTGKATPSAAPEKKTARMFGWFKSDPQDKLKKDLRKKNIVVLQNTAEGMDGGLLDLAHRSNVAGAIIEEQDLPSQSQQPYGTGTLSASVDSKCKALPGLIPHFASLKSQQSHLLIQQSRSTFTSGSPGSQRPVSSISKNTQSTKISPESFQTAPGSGTEFSHQDSPGISSDSSGRDESSATDLFDFEVPGSTSLQQSTCLEVDVPPQGLANPCLHKPQSQFSAGIPSSDLPHLHNRLEQAAMTPSELQHSEVQQNQPMMYPYPPPTNPPGSSPESDSEIVSSQLWDSAEFSRGSSQWRNNPGRPILGTQYQRNAPKEPTLSILGHSNIKNFDGYATTEGQHRLPRRGHRQEPWGNPGPRATQRYDLSNIQEIPVRQERLSRTVTAHGLKGRSFPAIDPASPSNPAYGHQAYQVMAQTPYNNHFNGHSTSRYDDQGSFAHATTRAYTSSPSYLLAAGEPSEFARLKKRRELYHKQKEARDRAVQNEKHQTGAANAA
ncbi:hypothetical protein Dda_4275 [Drechslerella dactyloides]|uniref:Uncharacterized protein n=1 Tax=Drechslerella dactyloides TaxID=74499 RepID=A0AAD6IZI1_DREDA|nr:hypothetical protein Dda_4275 [Drechslerella dactyloides]